ncbi:MAG: hypothetical protein ACHQ2Z_03745 [Elusimicrobiota bacterium]
MRNRLFAGAALAVALACACKRPPEAAAPAASTGPALAAPSFGTVKSPLGGETSSYTNEMQAQNLRDQAADLGISKFAKPTVGSGLDPDERPHRTITYQEGVQRTLKITRQAEAARHAIEGDKNKSVAIPTQTPGNLSVDKTGSPIESSPEAPGPKDPQ